MNTFITIVVVFSFPFLALAATTQPTTEPAHDHWTSSPATGSQILHSFPSAPYPHPSRANGLHSSNGDFPAAEHYMDSTVGIVIPPNYVPSDTVSYVVHFHGWGNHVSRVIPFYRLAEQLASSKVNAILIVPQGPKDASDSGDGKLELDPDGFKHLISDVTSYLNTQHKIHTKKIGDIALSAHSGGYKVTARILIIGGLTDHISDVILLDASYGNLEDFASWLGGNKTDRLVSFHTQHLDKANKELMDVLDMNRSNYREIPETNLTAETLAPRTATFISTTLAHNDVPMKTNFLSLCLQSSALPKIPTK